MRMRVRVRVRIRMGVREGKEAGATSLPSR